MIKVGVGFTTEEGSALLAWHGDTSRLELKIVSKEELDRLMNRGDGHVVGLRPGGAALQ